MDFNKLTQNKTDSLTSNILENPLKNIPSIEESIKISKKYNIAIHPRYLYYWTELEASSLIKLLEHFQKHLNLKDNTIYIDSLEEKRNLEKLAIEHTLKDNNIILNELNTKILLLNLGIDITKTPTKDIINNKITQIIKTASQNLEKTTIEILNINNELEIRDKAGTYIGARMGRPEKAKMRKQFNDETRSHGLFPVGEQGGRLKNLVEVLSKKGFVEENFRTYFCKQCNKNTIYPHCEVCGEKASQKFFEKYTGKEIDLAYVENTLNEAKNLIDLYEPNSDEDFGIDKENLKKYFKIIFDLEELDEKTLNKIKIILTNLLHKIELNEENKEVKEKYLILNRLIHSTYFSKQKLDIQPIQQNLRNILGPNNPFPKHVKGIGETINKHHTTEHIIKGFLREKHKVFVNKDGTVRYDMIEMGLTHFKPKEIGTSIKKLIELGYTQDYHGNPLENEDQIVEMFPQDVVMPDCPVSGEELSSDMVMNTGNYVDELLEKFYGMKPFYNFKTKEDTVGHLIIGLAPHTSAGIVGRIIGYSKTQGCFSHPVWHAAQRRNLDGDENGIMLLVDGLINFSREYLPDRRGSRTMDVSLVLTAHLYLDQVDDEVHGMDIVPYYPLEFYRANKDYVSPKSVKIEKVDKRLDEPDADKRYLHYKFTHNVDNMNNTILCSSYKSVPSMTEKLDLQLDIARKLRAVEEDKVGSFVIDKHFMKDIKGNLRKFSMQQFRCTNCNTKFRRPPLIGKCTNCGETSINFTISEGSVKKYVGPSFKIIEDLNVDPYIAECVELVNLRLEGVFGKELEKQKSLNSFFK